jgi:hypothetical protein
LSTRPGSRFRWGPRCRRTARRSPRLARSAAAGALSLTRLWRPLARGVLPVRAAHLAALSGAVRGRGERKTHFSSTDRGSHVSLSRVCARGARGSRARGARAALAQPPARSSVRHSLDGDRVCHLNPRGLRLGQFFTKDESHDGPPCAPQGTGHVPRCRASVTIGDLFPYQYLPISPSAPPAAVIP